MQLDRQAGVIYPCRLVKETSMGWLSQRAVQWAVNQQRQELETYIDMLRALDGSDLGMLVVGVAHTRHVLEAAGHNVMDPVIYTSENPAFASYLSGLVVECQRAGRYTDAAPLMVWTHTMRAGMRLELRGLAREMWGEISRGFPHALGMASEMRSTSGGPVNLHDAFDFPTGFSPKPR